MSIKPNFISLRTCLENPQEYYAFNSAGELQTLQSTHPHHTLNIDYHYQRDALGRIVKLNDIAYSYDLQGRLTQANTQTFTYDAAGNNQHHNAQYNERNNQLLEDNTFTYTYDKRGNLARKIDKQTQELYIYKYNALNQLIHHYKATAEDSYIYKTDYLYDALNRRIVKTTYTKATDTTTSHRYLYHNENIIAILDNTQKEPTLLASIVHHPSRTDTPLSITNHTTNQTYYYHRDHQGSIIALTNQEGKVVESIAYDGHYGTILNHTIQEENLTLNPYGYTGREIDQSDLYYYRARYYDPTTQRFLSKDPIEFEAGDFNFYRYVSNDPLNFVDPSGLASSGGHGAGRTYSGMGDFMSGVTKGTTDIVDGLVGIPKGLWDYYNHLLNATGYTDLVKGHEVPICQCQAQLEEKAIVYAVTKHPDLVAKFVWKDIKKRPNYYITGFLIGPGLGNISKNVAGEATHAAKSAQAAASSVSPVTTPGGVIDLMSSKINNFTGCY